MKRTEKISLSVATGGFGLALVSFFTPVSWLEVHPDLRAAGQIIGLIILCGSLCWLFFGIRRFGSSAEPLEYLNAPDVIDYMATESWWGIIKQEQAVTNGEEWLVRDGAIHLIALKEFSETAREGNIRVMGREGGVGNHIEIPSSHWLGSQLSDKCLTETRRSRTEPLNLASSIVYADLLFAKSDIQRAWPKPPWWWWA